VKVYNASIAAISRAFARLEKRGLVKRWKGNAHAAAGIALTPAGYQAAWPI
jgi:DNA-binding MarR family transcriptional regulator